MSSSASGQALSVRQAEESETFDLGGQNVTTITNTINAAFSDPLPLKEMIRLTFVTGAGKLGRQKYDEGAARAVTSTLRNLGYEEDRAASCVIECAGTFKLQHDTGKNLKTVVVFPKIQSPDGDDDGDDGTGGGGNHLVPPDCPAGQIARSSPNVFKNMIKAKCPSWSQKKGCSAALEKLKDMVAELDDKLMRGTPLNGAEQDFYDTTTGLDDKLVHCREALQQQVESGGVTKFELDYLLEQNSERLETLNNDMKTAKGQKLEKLKTMKQKATQRKEMLQNLEPKAPHKLKHEIEIARLWKEAVPLLQVEEKCKGRLASVKETQMLARKDEIMEEIEAYEDASRGWFENDDAFDARVKAIRAHFTAKLNQKPKSSKKAPGTSYASALTGSRGGGGTAAATRKVGGGFTGTPATPIRNDNFVVPSQKNAWGSANKKKKKSSNKGTGVFAAMMAKDDDDSDSDNFEAEPERDTFYDDVVTNVVQPTTATDNTTTSTRADAGSDDDDDDDDNNAPASDSKENQSSTPNKKKGKKKNKKTKGKKKKSETDMSEDELLNAAAAANAAAKKAEEDAQEVSHPAIAFLKNYLIPFILWFIAFIVSLFFGKPKQKKK